MPTDIQCFIAAYSGLNRNSSRYLDLIKKDPSIKKIPISLNAAITYLGSALNKKGINFEFINSIEDDSDWFLNRIKNEEKYCIGISTTLCSDISYLKSFINKIKAVNPKTVIILGGALIVNYIRILKEKGDSIFHHSTRSLQADYIIDSIYGEDIFAQLTDHIINHLPCDQIANIYQRIDGKFRYTYSLKKEYDLTGSRVNWELFKGKTGATVSIRTSVSCCFHCMFCSYPVRAGTYMCLTVGQLESVLDHIEALGEVKLVHFIDDTFNIPLKRFKEILRMMIRNQYSFQWHSYLRCQSLDEEAVQLMKQSGCIGVFLGLESGSDIVLEAMNKQVKVEQYRKGVALLNKYQITIVASFFAGFPGETADTLKETESFIKEIKPSFYYLGPWIYDQRTPIYKHRNNYGLTGIQNKWSHKSMNSEWVSQIITEIKKSIVDSVLVENIDYTFLFQLIHYYMGIEPVIKHLKGWSF